MGAGMARYPLYSSALITWDRSLTEPGVLHFDVRLTGSQSVLRDPLWPLLPAVKFYWLSSVPPTLGNQHPKSDSPRSPGCTACMFTH